MQKDVIFKERLILRRNALNLTQMQLAEKSGVSWRSISDYENDKSLPSHENTQKLARALGVTVAFLMGEENIIEGSVQERPKSDLVGYSELPTEQLEKLLANMAAKLKTFSSPERKHVLGNLRSIVDELEERELKPSPAAVGSKLLRKAAEGVKEKPPVTYPKRRGKLAGGQVSSGKDVADELADAVQEELEPPPDQK